MATFASEYRVIYSETSPNNPNVFHLQNNMGVIQKRTRSSPAVIRYAKFSVTRDAEKYYKTILKLYLPFRKENQLKPNDFETSEMFFRSGHVKLSDENVLHKVCDIVNADKQHFEKNSNETEHAMNEYERTGPVFDAWSEIAPEIEIERLETANDCEPVDPESVGDTVISDLTESGATHSASVAHDLRSTTNNSQIQIKHALQSMNTEQSACFYYIRKWCIDKINNKNPAPFRIFVTGGAGTVT